MNYTTYSELILGKKALRRKQFVQKLSELAYPEDIEIDGEGHLYVALHQAYEDAVPVLLVAAREGIGIEHGRESTGETTFFYYRHGRAVDIPVSPYSLPEIAGIALHVRGQLELVTQRDLDRLLKALGEYAQS